MLNNLVSQFAANCGGGFLFLRPWHFYLRKDADCNIRDFNLLPAPNGTSQTPSDLPLVLLVVVDNLIRVAGLIAVIFIIYGGVMYATSQGSPDQAAKAQSTIINALIGLVIAVTAVVIVGFIGRQLG